MPALVPLLVHNPSSLPSAVASKNSIPFTFDRKCGPEAAVPDLESAAASDPSNGMILDRLGQTYRALDRLADAIRVLRRAASVRCVEQKNADDIRKICGADDILIETIPVPIM